ncbi:membrane protein [Gordonia phage Burley]|nr:membrane protein [Gordonia phage Burley]
MIFDIMLVGLYLLIVVIVLKVVINAVGDFINKKGK